MRVERSAPAEPVATFTPRGAATTIPGKSVEFHYEHCVATTT